MERGAVILVENEELIVIERVRNGQTYYLFPGGGVEAGESREEAARREAREELGLDVRIERLVAVVSHDGNQQYHFLASMVDGQFGTGSGAELQWTDASTPEGSYRPVRLSLSSLGDYDVRPKALAACIASGRLSEKNSVLYFQD